MIFKEKRILFILLLLYKDLDRAQNLNQVLNPRIPILPELVNIGQAQVLGHALRRSARNTDRPRTDYKQLHEKGRQN